MAALHYDNCRYWGLVKLLVPPARWRRLLPARRVDNSTGQQEYTHWQGRSGRASSAATCQQEHKSISKKPIRLIVSTGVTTSRQIKIQFLIGSPGAVDIHTDLRANLISTQFRLRCLCLSPVRLDSYEASPHLKVDKFSRPRVNLNVQSVRDIIKRLHVRWQYCQ